MRQRCSVEYTELDNDYGYTDGVVVTCDRCGRTTESFGTEEGSIKRCLYLLSEECPGRVRIWYYTDE